MPQVRTGHFETGTNRSMGLTLLIKDDYGENSPTAYFHVTHRMCAERRLIW